MGPRRLAAVMGVAGALAFGTVRAQAAELAGVSLPDRLDAGGAHLVLNGLALRTYSLLRIHIYVAGLYLIAHSSDPEAIISSAQPRLLRFVFTRDVEAEEARKSWRESLDASCRPPCSLPPDEVAQFLAGVPSVHKGDVSTLLFDGPVLTIELNGATLGHIPDPAFGRVILSTFIGAHPTANSVKSGLLGLEH